jgi:uncharacterized protein (DUF3820 family)
MSAKRMPFGKYKSQPLGLVKADNQYVGWLAKQPWFVERFAELCAYLTATSATDMAREDFLSEMGNGIERLADRMGWDNAVTAIETNIAKIAGQRSGNNVIPFPRKARHPTDAA